MPPGKAIVQTTDVLAPIVNDAKSFGKIAAANALSDVYAMGGEPWCAMTLAFFPPALAANDGDDTLLKILEGSFDTLREADAAPAGGHTVQDEELKFGLAVTGVIDPNRIARNDGLRPGQILVLTKPLGVGILATGIKAGWDFAQESEAAIIHWCAKLNVAGARVINSLGLSAATDVTGFGLGGHILEMALASKVTARISAKSLPILPNVLNYAADGLVPAGTHANQNFCAPHTYWPRNLDKALLSVIFDAQTSGGLLLAMDEAQYAGAEKILTENGDIAAVVGRVEEPRSDGKNLIIT